MKLAIVDHMGNPGGGSRYLRALVSHFIQLRPELRITFFGNSESIEREKIREEWGPLNIQIRELTSLWLLKKGIFGIKGTRLFMRIIQHRFSGFLKHLPYFFSGAIHRELERKLKGFDLVFFPWPYFVSLPRLSCPVLGVFHDFNFRYQFCGQGYSPESLSILYSDIPVWLEHCIPIVSTHFMHSELKKFYPEFAYKAKIAHLAPMSALSKMDRQSAREIVDLLKIPKEYILCPTNISPHKNLGPLFSAFHLLKKRGWSIPLVIAGYGTEHLNGQVWELGLQRDATNKEIIGLGYVTNDQIDALVQCAKIVVNPSLYEAGNGSGLDAWGKGVPVAMSNIPSFLEHLEVQGVKAKVFDPRSPKDIADKLEEILLNPPIQEVEASQQAMSKWTWETTAQKYLSIFDEALRRA